MAVKKFRPTTPSRREMTMASFEEIRSEEHTSELRHESISRMPSSA